MLIRVQEPLRVDAGIVLRHSVHSEAAVALRVERLYIGRQWRRMGRVWTGAQLVSSPSQSYAAECLGGLLHSITVTTADLLCPFSNELGRLHSWQFSCSWNTLVSTSGRLLLFLPPGISLCPGVHDCPLLKIRI